MVSGFARVREKLREYPHCVELLYHAALVLDGGVMMAGLPEEERGPFRKEITALYEQAARCGGHDVALQARYMLASRHLEAGQDDKAREMLDLLPDWSALDKRGMQAELWSRQGEAAKAATLLEGKLLMSFQDHQSTLFRLIRLAIQEEDEGAAQALADCGAAECRAFALGEYWAHIAPLELAVARRDASACMAALAVMLEAASELWSIGCPPCFPT